MIIIRDECDVLVIYFRKRPPHSTHDHRISLADSRNANTRAHKYALLYGRPTLFIVPKHILYKLIIFVSDTLAPKPCAYFHLSLSFSYSLSLPALSLSLSLAHYLDATESDDFQVESIVSPSFS